MEEMIMETGKITAGQGIKYRWTGYPDPDPVRTRPFLMDPDPDPAPVF